MIIGIDIRCFANTHRTGVGEYTYELLTALFLAYPEYQFVLFMNAFRDDSFDIPDWKFSHVHMVRTRWPNKVFHLCQLLGLFSLDAFVWRRVKQLFPGAAGFDWWYSPNMHVMSLSKQVPFVLTMHDLSFDIYRDCFYWRQRLKHWLVRPRRLCQRAQVIVVLSENTKHDIVTLYGIPDDRVHVVYPGVSSLFQTKEIKKSGISLPEQFVLFLGTLEPRKNVMGIMLAHQALPLALRAAFPFVIAGSSGWKSDDVRAIMEHDPYIQYLGYVSAEDKPTLYTRARVFLFPSLYEGFGFPVLEAMACGTAVITSNSSSLFEVTGGAAVLVDPLDVNDISAALRDLLEHDILCHSLGEKGRERSMLFSWQKTAREFGTLLDRV